MFPLLMLACAAWWLIYDIVTPVLFSEISIRPRCPICRNAMHLTCGACSLRADLLACPHRNGVQGQGAPLVNHNWYQSCPFIGSSDSKKHVVLSMAVRKLGAPPPPPNDKLMKAVSSCYKTPLLVGPTAIARLRRHASFDVAGLFEDNVSLHEAFLPG